MTLTWFLTTVLLCMAGLWWIGLWKAPRVRSGLDLSQTVRYLVWGLLGAAALLTVNTYTFPSNPDRFYSNLDHHLLVHEGFEVGEEAWMAHPDPQVADLQDGLDGKWWLRTGDERTMHFEDCHFPVFLQNETGSFILANPMLKAPLNDRIRLAQSEGVLLEMRWRPDGDTVRYEVDFQGGAGWQPSTFNQVLYRGYPIDDILRQVEGWERYREKVLLLENSWLVREVRGDSSSPIHFFPSRLLADSLHLPLQEVPEQSFREGQRFFAGLGLDKGPAMYLTNGSRIHFDFPVRYRLADDPENDLFLCSDFADVAQEDKRGGFLFPYFREKAHPLHVYGSLRFERGDARTPVEMWVTDQQASGESGDPFVVHGGEEFSLQARDGQHQWLFRLQDLRADNPIQPLHLRLFVLGFMALVFLWLGLLQKGKGPGPFESVVVAFLFGLLVVRVLLQWRMGTFPPVEEVRPSEWAFLRSSRHYWVTVGVVALFWGLRFWWMDNGPFAPLRRRTGDALGQLGKVLEPLWDRLRTGLEAESFQRYALSALVLMAVCGLPLLLLRGLGVDQLERFVNIAFPVAFFLYLAHLNARYRQPGKRYHYLGLNPFSLFNGLLTFGYLAVTDAGFSIVFLLFLLIWESFRRTWTDLHGTGRRQRRGWLLVGAAILALVVVLVLADRVIALVFEWPVLFYWLGVVPVLGAGAWYFGGLVLSEIGQAEGWKRHAPLLLAVVVFGLASPWGIKAVKNLSYVRFRAEIHHRDLDQIIEREQFDSGQMGQVLRAAQNQWFINNYLQEPLSAGSGSAFTLRQHFNKGSSYTTQTTDLVVTRYLIAEHSSMLVFLMILGWLLLGLAFFWGFSLREKTMVVPLGALLLLFAVSLFIWLTATNRFVFFGQDFPLISLTSLFTLVFSLGLLLFVLVKTEGEKPRQQLKHPGMLVPGVAFLGLLVFLALGNPVLEEKTFHFNLSLENARADLDGLDEQFVAFQDTLTRELEPDTLVRSFAVTLPGEQVSNSAFVQSVWEHFVREQKDKSDPAELLHLVVRRGRYHLAMNRSYYLIRPPRERRLEWGGNLLAASEGNGTFLLDIRDRDRRYRIDGSRLEPNLEAGLADLPDRINLAVLPHGWTPDPKPMVLLWSDGTGGKGPDFSLSNHALPGRGSSKRQAASRLLTGDLLTIPVAKGAARRFRYQEDHRQYLARNLWLNGERQWFYPLGEKLLWAYYYANAIEGAYVEAGKPATDVGVSIDYTLTERLAAKVEERFQKEQWERQRLGVVALNGDGQLRLMLDYQLEQVDPNDIGEFSDKNREFYLRNNTRLERETFGNINLLKLPNGPGSTLKPIAYAAVTSQFRMDWAGLSLESPPAIIRDTVWDAETDRVRWYGGKRINLEWSGISEGDFLRITPREYIVRSRNLYHSVVNYLGAFPAEDLQRRLVEGEDAILLPPDVKHPEMNFPLLGLKGRLWRINPDSWPSTEPGARTLFGNKRSLIAQGFYDNFDLPTYFSRDRVQDDYVNFDPAGEDVFGYTRKGHLLFAYPEQPTFYQEMRAVEGPLWFIRGLKQVTAGNDPMRVTPVKVAEMAGRLFRMDRSFAVQLGDSVDRRPAADFVVDPAWTEDSYQRFLRQYIFQSMEEVVRKGTASILGNWLRARKSDYHYYGKTGTIKNADDPYSLEDRLLLLVISKGDVTEMTTEELRRNKFYVVFITGWEMDVKPAMKRWEMVFDIVREIESSYLFQQYMHGEEEA